MNLSLTGRKIGVLLCALLFAAMGVWAQTGTTSVHGVVTDKTGAAIVGAKITLANSGLGLTREASSDPTGEYDFLSLPPSTYVLTIEKAGFRKFEQTHLHLLVNSPATVNVTLEIGTTSETIEVSAQTVTLNTTDASLGVAFDANQIKSLPLDAGNIPELLSLQAGVVYMGNRPDINRNTDTRSGAVNGAHSDQSNITLDGVGVNDETQGFAFTSVLPVTQDSVEEFRVTTTNYNADQGRSSGAQVSLVTKGGTNQYHGSLFESHRNTITSAGDYFVKGAELRDGFPNKPLKLIRNVFGGSVGGPILKDRFFFFINYEGYRQAEENSVVRIVPSATMRDGVILYKCDTTSPTVATDCPGGNGIVSGASGKTYNVPAGFFGLSSSRITTMDPLGIGPSAVMLPYLQGFPLANDTSVGDGVNFTGFRFRGPIATHNNWYIARADYKITRNGNHTIFWRGALRNDLHGDVPYFAGMPPEQTIADRSKGFTVGYTGVLRPTLINNFRWGFTRQSYGNTGNNSKQQFIYFRFLNDNETSNNSSLAITRSRNFQVPVHNFVDDVSWIKGRHTLQFGVNVAFIRNPRASQLNSFSDGFTNASWLDAAGMANSGSAIDMDPGQFVGLPAVDSSFNNSYDYPMIALMGAVTQVDANYNYLKDGSILPQGAPTKRHFAADSYEFYAQDSFRLKPNLTLNFGLRYSLFSPPWETTGLQVSPTMSLGKWFNQRGQNMLKGVPSNMDPLVSFDLSGPANGGKLPWYNWDYKDFGPRISVAWSPRGSGGLLKSLFGDGGKTTIRTGFGIVYDRIGQGLLTTFDRSGSFGLATGLTNPAAGEDMSTAPRLTGLNTIPTVDNTGATLFLSAPPGKYPQTFPSTLSTGGFAITWGVDDQVKTPYSYTLDFSVGRELPMGFSLEASYVGRLSHRLLAQSDLAMPLDLVDPKTKVDYFSAVTALAKIYKTGVQTQNVTAAMVGPTASYWADMLQSASAAGQQYRIRRCTGGITTGTIDPVQAAYDLFCGFASNETTALFVLDVNGGMRGFSGGAATSTFFTPIGGENSYFNAQYSSLYAWRSIGIADYHALQVNVRHRLSHGVQFDLNYTFSKSLDLASDAERIGAWGGLGGEIINSWQPKALHGPSDFNSPHQINANWIIELPFGQGKAIGKDAHGFAQTVIGGWELAGLARWTSGFPVNFFNGATWPTNWQLGGEAIRIGSTKTGVFKNPDGSVNMFADPSGATGINAFRHDFPGESGQRNVISGPGFVGLDLGLGKSWKMPWAEGQKLQFRWEVFNVPNFTRFDVQSATTSLDQASAFGKFTGLLTNPRSMQFSLRYEF
jgi:carboxypeptidase family protein